MTLSRLRNPAHRTPVRRWCVEARSRVIHAIVGDNKYIAAEQLPDGTVRLRHTPPAVFPFGDEHPFGLAISGTTVTIYPGEIERADLTPAVTAEATRYITADQQYIGIAYDADAHSLSITSPSGTKPTSSGRTWRTWLYQFNLNGTKATLRRHNITTVRLPAMYGG